MFATSNNNICNIKGQHSQNKKNQQIFSLEISRHINSKFDNGFLVVLSQNIVSLTEFVKKNILYTTYKKSYKSKFYNVSNEPHFIL